MITATVYYMDGTKETISHEDLDMTEFDTYFQIDTPDQNRFIPFTAVKKVECSEQSDS